MKNKSEICFCIYLKKGMKIFQENPTAACTCDLITKNIKDVDFAEMSESYDH